MSQGFTSPNQNGEISSQIWEADVKPIPNFGDIYQALFQAQANQIINRSVCAEDGRKKPGGWAISSLWTIHTCKGKKRRAKSRDWGIKIFGFDIQTLWLTCEIWWFNCSFLLNPPNEPGGSTMFTTNRWIYLTLNKYAWNINWACTGHSVVDLFSCRSHCLFLGWFCMTYNWIGKASCRL